MMNLFIKTIVRILVQTTILTYILIILYAIFL